MKRNFLYSTKLQLPPELLTRGLPPPDPRSLCPLSWTDFVERPPPNKIPRYSTVYIHHFVLFSEKHGAVPHVTAAPRSPFSLSSVLNWICWTPHEHKIPGYSTVYIHHFVLFSEKHGVVPHVTAAPRSPFSLSPVFNWICWTPHEHKIPGYSTVYIHHFVLFSEKHGAAPHVTAARWAQGRSYFGPSMTISDTWTNIGAAMNTGNVILKTS